MKTKNKIQGQKENRRTRCREKNRGLSLLALLLAIGMLWMIPPADTEAAGSLTYGSAEYTPQVNGEFPVGVYVATNDGETIGNYRAVLTYDPEKLEYVSGGTLLEPGRIEISGGGGQTSYRTMLALRTLVMGNSMIHVESLEVYADEEGTQPIEISGAVDVAVRVPVAPQNQLSALLMDGQPVEGFSPETSEYHLTVPYETAEPSITATAADASARISISDTALTAGENHIAVEVSYQGQRMVYDLYVTREAEAAETVADVSPGDTDNGTGTDTGTHHMWQEMSGLQKFLLVIGIVAAVGLAAMLIMVLQEMARRKKRRRLKEQWEKRNHLGSTLKKEETGAGVENGQIDGAAEEERTRSSERDQEKPVISVKDVCMYFKIALDGSDSLKEFLIRTLTGRNQFRELKALDHVSFDVRQGEVVGIIGTNGSGKSTLLKIISGALDPTRGKVEVDRKKVQLLTLGTGFDMELTARENVYLNGSLIGYTRDYIDEKFDDIVNFAELEGFMDERMKNFSSGMVSRLGFAIATMRDTPEILILDEVLSVGDMFFQKKSLARVKEMMHGGSTVLIVSHSPGVIRQNCTRAIWIEKGILKADGDPKEVCALYEKQAQG